MPKNLLEFCRSFNHIFGTEWSRAYKLENIPTDRMGPQSITVTGKMGNQLFSQPKIKNEKTEDSFNFVAGKCTHAKANKKLLSQLVFLAKL